MKERATETIDVYENDNSVLKTMTATVTLELNWKLNVTEATRGLNGNGRSQDER